MKSKGLVVATVVLAALLGALYWSNHHNATSESTVKASPDAAPKMLSLNQLDITNLSIQRKNQPALELSRNPSGTWQITSPEALAADQDSVTSVLGTISSLTADRLVDEKAANLASYGLAAPPLEVSATLKDKKTSKLLVGDKTPSGNAYYAMLEGDPRLFTIPTYDESNLDKSTSELRDKRLFTGDFDKVSQIQLINQDPKHRQDITFARNKDAWQILKPSPARAESYEMDNLVRSLREATMDTATAADQAKNSAAFKSGTPFAIAKISGASGTQELQVRKVKDDYYATSSAVAGVYKVPGTLATNLNKTLEDFRSKKLFDFGFADPNKVEIQDGAKSYFLTRSGSDWWGQDGKKLDDSTVEVLVGHLRDLAATKFPEAGYTSATVEITVTSNDGKRVEKVGLAKSKDRYIAKRENEPALYEIPGTSVQQIEEAASGLKPAAAPNPAPDKKK